MIRAAEIRVIDDEGQQLGVMTPDDAIRQAEEVGLDLVEVAPGGATARVPDHGLRAVQVRTEEEDQQGQGTRGEPQGGQAAARAPISTISTSS